MSRRRWSSDGMRRSKNGFIYGNFEDEIGANVKIFDVIFKPIIIR